MSAGEVQEHRRVAAGRHDASGRGRRRETTLLQMAPSARDLHPVLAIEAVVGAAARSENRGCAWHLLELATGQPATFAIADDAQNGSAYRFERHLTAGAGRRETGLSGHRLLTTMRLPSLSRNSAIVRVGCQGG